MAYQMVSRVSIASYVKKDTVLQYNLSAPDKSNDGLPGCGLVITTVMISYVNIAE